MLLAARRVAAIGRDAEHDDGAAADDADRPELPMSDITSRDDAIAAR